MQYLRDYYGVWSFHCLLPVEPGHSTSLALMCDSVHGVLPIKEAHLSAGISELLLGLCDMVIVDSLRLVSVFSLQLL